MISVLLFLLSTSAATSVEALKAGELYTFCKSKDGMIFNACKFYILGVVEGMRAAGSKPAGQQKFCMGYDVPASKMIDAFIRMADKVWPKYPGDKELPAVASVSAAITLAYPCFE
jgi:hypothetical protein